MTRILLVEDEPQMSSFIARGLAEEDFAIDVCSDGDDALHLMGKGEYDLVLLDVMLPGKDGVTVCREARSREVRAPILILTALGGVDDTVNALDCGADDYLHKPFDFGVLVARIRALLRRARPVRTNILRVADLSLNTLDHTAVRGSRTIRLTAKEYALLELLMLRSGCILGRAQIAEHVWDETFDPLSNIIDVYMNRLRKKIDQGFESRLIHTLRAEGYMLAPQAQQSSNV